MSKSLKIALPKGSLQEPTIKLLEKAGYNVYMSDRGLRPSSDDSELDIYLIRAQEIARYIDSGFIDCGITGLDWAYENRASLVVGITERYLEEKGVKADIEFSWGATEVKVPDLVDAIVDVTETGSSIRANNLRIVDTLLTSFPHFYSGQDAYKDDWKKAKMDSIVLMLRAALEARDKVGLKMNLPEKNLSNVLESLPSLRRPTISQLAEEGWVAVETVIEESVARQIIPTLKELGAEGIIEYPLNKLVY